MDNGAALLAVCCILADTRNMNTKPPDLEPCDLCIILLAYPSCWPPDAFKLCGLCFSILCLIELVYIKFIWGSVNTLSHEGCLLPSRNPATFMSTVVLLQPCRLCCDRHMLLFESCLLFNINKR